MIKSSEIIREENIKTVFDFEKWIKEKTKYKDKISTPIFDNIVDNLIGQIRDAGRRDSVDFITKLKELKERKKNEK